MVTALAALRWLTIAALSGTGQCSITLLTPSHVALDIPYSVTISIDPIPVTSLSVSLLAEPLPSADIPPEEHLNCRIEAGKCTVQMVHRSPFRGVFTLTAHVSDGRSAQAEVVADWGNQPAGVTFYEGSNFQGNSRFISCCGAEPFATPHWDSLWPSGGIKVSLFSLPNQAGLRVDTILPIASLKQVGVRKGRRVQTMGGRTRSLDVQRVTAINAVLLFQGSNYSGASLLVPVSDKLASSLPLATVGSVRVPEGVSVVFFANGRRQGSVEEVPPWEVSSDTRDLTSAGIAASDAVLVSAHCAACVHGTCTSPQQCSCDSGWMGVDCTEHAVDSTSCLICEHNTALVGVSLSCSLMPRYGGKAVPARRSAFHVTLLQELGVLRWHDNEGESRLQEEFALDFIPSQATEPRHVFASTVAESGESLFQHSIAVFWQPDATSLIECDKAVALAGEPIHCALHLRRNALPCVAPLRAISLRPAEGLAAPGRLSVLSSANGETAAEQWTFWLKLSTAHTGSVAPFTISAADRPLQSPQLQLVAASADPVARARVLMYSWRFVEALKLVSDALRAQLESPDAAAQLRALRSQLLTLTGRFDQALSQMASLAPSPAQANKVKFVKRLRSEKGRAIVAFTNRRWREAAGSLVGLLKHAPEALQLRLMRATCALHLDEYGTVRSDTSFVMAKAAPRASAVSEARLVLAVAIFSLLGRVPDAAKSLQECVRRGGHGVHCIEALDEVMAVQKTLEEVQAHRQASRHSMAAQLLLDLCESDIVDGGLEGDGVVVNGLPLRLPRRRYIELSSQACIEASEAADWKLVVSACTVAIGLGYDKQSVEAEEAHAACLLARAEGWLRTDQLLRAKLDLQLLRRLYFRGDVNKLQSLEDEINASSKQEEQQEKVDHFDVLGLARDATLAQIKKAYRMLSLKWHPDKHKKETKDAATEMFLKVSEAYEILSDPYLRTKWESGISDEELQKERRTQFRPEFHVHKEDLRRTRQQGEKVKAWFFNSRGEKEYTDIDPTWIDNEKCHRRHIGLPAKDTLKQARHAIMCDK